MEHKYSTIEGTSRGYKVLVAMLGVMVGVFIVSFLVAYLKGQQVWGVSTSSPGDSSSPSTSSSSASAAGAIHHLLPQLRVQEGDL